MGLLLLRLLRLSFDRGEQVLFAFAGGSACLSLVVFALSLVHQAKWQVFVAAGVAAIAGAGWERPKKPPPQLASLLILTPFFIAYFLNALAPEVSPDGSGYHLGNVARFWRHHGFVWDYHSMYSYLSQGAEVLYLFAFTFGRHSSAALVHLAFFAALPLLMVAYGRRFGFPRAGWFAAVLAYTCPVAGLAGSSAYNDLAVATVLFAVFYLLQVWDESRDGKLLILIGLLAGFGYALKYTAFLAVPFALTFVYWRLRDLRALLVPLGAAIPIAPWVVRNWIWLGNPVAPFLNRWFPNQYFHPGQERSYLADLGTYQGINHFWEIPLQLTLHGRFIQGIIGPVWLLAPLALLALRHTQGRRLLAAGAVFAIPAGFNTGARFLLPAIPFLALAIGIACSNSWGVLPALAVFEALVCWPAVLALYADPVSWRLREIPVRAAFRRESEREYLARRLPDYALKDAIERAVAPEEKIFSFITRAEAYIDRDIVVSYESSLGNQGEDILYTPLYHPPIVRRHFGFARRNALGVRTLENAAGKDDWRISEVKMFCGGRELERSPAWKITAWPNPWEALLAFDGSPATRWSTWQAVPPGSFLAVQFGREEALDEVILEGPVDAAQVSVEILERGRWVPVGGKPDESRIAPPPDLRREATRQLAGRGIRYLLINDSDFIAADLKQHAAEWAITRIAEVRGTTLYRID